MSDHPFWLSEEQFGRLKPLLLDKVRGVARVDDLLAISGIVHVLKSGCRWVDTPPEFGPRKTLYNRFVRWTEKGIWQDIFIALADSGGPPSQTLIDSSAVRAHRSASGGKGGRKRRASVVHGAGGRPRPTPSRTGPAARSGSSSPAAMCLTAGRLKDFRHIGTRYDRRADVFLAVVCLAATVSYWL